MKTKEQVVSSLKELLLHNEDVVAVWEGGSVATGYDDEYSDLDLSIICEDDAVEAIFPLLDRHLDKELGIERKFRVPEPVWHGASQCFYLVKNVPELYYLDIVVIKKTNPNKLTEIDRHGTARVWFEKEKIIDNRPTSPEEVMKRAKHFYNLVTQSDFLHIIEIKKTITRRNYVEAYPMYYQFITRHLGIMLNLKYRVCKVDFGLRYCSRDYPNDIVKFLESAFKVGTIDELAEKFAEIENVYHQLKTELAVLYKETAKN